MLLAPGIVIHAGHSSAELQSINVGMFEHIPEHTPTMPHATPKCILTSQCIHVLLVGHV